MDTRPSERLSTNDHSSATRTGLCKGSTTDPARMPIRLVIIANAPAVTEGLGNMPPNVWKWRSGVQTAQKP